MSAWTPAQLDAIDAEDDLTIITRRSDGSLRDPVIVWVVRHDGNLYIRAVRGRTSPWFRGALSRREGMIQSGGHTANVLFEDAPESINDVLDAAYLRKYGHYRKDWVDPTVTPEARAATLRVVPQ